MRDYEHLRAELTLAPAASESAVARLRGELGAQVPDDWLAFLLAHDGAEGPVGVLVPAAEVGRGADLYPELDHLREFLRARWCLEADAQARAHGSSQAKAAQEHGAKGEPRLSRCRWRCLSLASCVGS
jgi:cell wall assembly regulator SMI1